MKILIHSNAPWVPSGYGQQTALWAPLLASLGHQVSISAFYGLSGGPMEWRPPQDSVSSYTVYPAGQHPYGWDVLAGHAQRAGADLVLTIMDTYVMDPEVIRALRAAGIKVAQWTPVDCKPLGAVDSACLKVSGAIPVAMSQFGRAQLQEAGFAAEYVPHGVDCRVFRPPADRAGLRERMGIDPGTFVIGICAANKDVIRKGFAEQFAAFAEFSDRHPDSLLMVHTVAEPGRSGLDLRALAAACGIAGKVHFTGTYAQVGGLVSPEQMAGWYGALDLLSNCSHGEGFGIPLLEAQACGVPVVATNASSMPQLVGSGVVVDGEPEWNPVHRAWWVKPDITEITEAWEAIYCDHAELHPGRARQARQHATDYDAMHVLEIFWRPLLDELAAAETVAELGGLKWIIGNRDRHGDVLALGHESDLEPHLLGLLPPGGVFLDIGAHVGHWALRAALKASKVIAVEAAVETADRLTQNAKLNGLDNVVIYRAAAWDSRQVLNLLTPSGHARDGSAQVRAGGIAGAEVDGWPLDILLGDEPRIDLVKLDVEGADLHVLRGMAGLLAEHKPVLFIEDHSSYDWATYTREQLLELLGELGYSAEELPLYRGYFVARHHDELIENELDALDKPE